MNKQVIVLGEKLSESPEFTSYQATFVKCLDVPQAMTKEDSASDEMAQPRKVIPAP